MQLENRSIHIYNYKYRQRTQSVPNTLPKTLLLHLNTKLFKFIIILKQKKPGWFITWTTYDYFLRNFCIAPNPLLNKDTEKNQLVYCIFILLDKLNYSEYVCQEDGSCK